MTDPGIVPKARTHVAMLPNTQRNYRPVRGAWQPTVVNHICTDAVQRGVELRRPPLPSSMKRLNRLAREREAIGVERCDGASCALAVLLLEAFCIASHAEAVPRIVTPTTAACVVFVDD